MSLQCLLSSWSKNFKLRTLTKYQSLNSLLTVQLLLFWFHLFRSADKIYEDETVVHLLLPPHPCNVTARTLSYLRHSPYADLALPPPILPSYWLAHRPITQSRFWPPEGEGGDRYNITTCRMAEGSKDPCISHVDASHGEWPRIESSLLFCIFFILSKS